MILNKLMVHFINGHLMCLRKSHLFSQLVQNIISIYIKLCIFMIGISIELLSIKEDIIEILHLCKLLTNLCLVCKPRLKKYKIMKFLFKLRDNMKRILQKRGSKQFGTEDKYHFDIFSLFIVYYCNYITILYHIKLK